MRLSSAIRSALSRVAVLVILAAGLPVAVLTVGSTPAEADTGGYPYSSAPCSDTTYVSNGVTYCAGDNWSGPDGLYDQAYGGYGYRNCTDWVAYRLATNNGYAMPHAIGNARAWGTYFTDHGHPPNNTPAVGAIAWEPGGDHVAYVEAVGSGTVTISEYNEGYYPGDPTAGDGLYDERPVATSAFEYIHVKDLSGGSGSGFEVAFQANTGNLYTYSPSSGAVNLALGMMPGTSPGVAAVNGGYEIAFQANTGSLWTVGAAGSQDWNLGMMPGTSPSITALAGGGYEVAFEANTGDLWTVGQGPGSSGTDWNLGMEIGTSPSIAGLTAGGFEVALETNTLDMWTVGLGGGSSDHDWSLGMLPGTGPAIAALPAGGFEVAVQTNTLDLWTAGLGAGSLDTDWNLGTMQGAESEHHQRPGWRIRRCLPGQHRRPLGGGPGCWIQQPRSAQSRDDGRHESEHRRASLWRVRSLVPSEYRRPLRRGVIGVARYATRHEDRN